MALLPPGGLSEIVFSFDTTGSMSSCLDEVRGRLQDMIQRLQADIPSIRIAVFAHGDYCDRHNYITKWIDFSTDVKKLCEFVKTVSSTGGGDSDECYELVLRQVQEELSWTPGSNRVLVMMGDANPHEPNYPDNKLKIDWRDEIKALADMGVKIYGTECKSCHSTKFYKTISEKTGGRHLQLENFSNIFDFLMAICYREHGAELFDVYEKEVRGRGCALSSDMEGMFTALRDGEDCPTTPAKKTPRVAAKKVARVPAVKKIDSGVKYGKGKLTGARTVKTPRIKIATKSKVVASKPAHVLSRVLRREEVPENNFALRDMNWSTWVPVICHTIPANEKAAHWDRRRGEGNGFRKTTIFKTKTNKPALYELAVQNIRYGRKFVVFQKFCRSIPDSCSWESRLFGNSCIRAQVNKVVSQSCKVFVRRALYRRAASHVTSTVPTLKSYDYAWRPVRKTRPNGRLVVKQGKTISADTI